MLALKNFTLSNSKWNVCLPSAATQTSRRLQRRGATSAMVHDAMCHSQFAKLWLHWLRLETVRETETETECLPEVMDHVCSPDIQVLPDSSGVSAAFASGAP
jgi:hypothetical protein